jgi:hypothetical protein
MALEIVQEYSLDEKIRLSLLPSTYASDRELTALEAVQFDHAEICSSTPQSAASRILQRDFNILKKQYGWKL